MGSQSLLSNISGIRNTGIGSLALSASTGDNNVALGYQAGNTNTTGNNNTLIGYGADVSTGNQSNSSALGLNATVNASNKIRLGNSAVTVIEGQPASYTSTSDGRFKTNVQEDVKGLEFIMKLRPVTYNFDRVSYSKFIGEKQTDDYVQTLKGLSNTRQTGFIAQEMEKAVSASGYKGFDAVSVPAGDHQTYGIAYATLVVPLVKAVQEQQAKIEALERNTAAGRELIEQLQKEIEGLKKMVNEKTTAGN
ncbi:MAG TPA: tail fiber domain-containing protein [Ferruginibacter sp.]|nr:tail fiber domain-containing protein [Ferruginibacter sp.]